MCVGAAIALAALTGAPVIAQGQLRSVGELGDFATNLSQTCPIPEGVAVDERTGTVFASSLGALALLLWITANDAEEIQALSPTGRLIARVRGIGVDATRNPAALAFRGRRLVITNFDARSAHRARTRSSRS